MKKEEIKESFTGTGIGKGILRQPSSETIQPRVRERERFRIWQSERNEREKERSERIRQLPAGLKPLSAASGTVSSSRPPR